MAPCPSKPVGLLDLLETLDTRERRRLTAAVIALGFSSISNIAFPLIMGKAVDMAMDGDGKRNKSFWCSVGWLMVMAAASGWLRVYSFKLVNARIQKSLRGQLFDSLVAQDLEAYSLDSKAGEILNAMTKDVEVAADGITDNLAALLRSLNSSIGGTVMLLILSRKLTLLSLSLLPCVGIAAMTYCKRARKITKSLQDSLVQATGFASEKLNHLPTVRIFGQEAFESTEFHKQLEEIDRLAKSAAHADGLFMGGLGLSLNLCLLAVLYCGASLVRKNEMTVGTLSSFAIYSSMVGLGFSGLSKVYGDHIKSVEASKTVLETIKNSRPSESPDTVLPIDGIKGKIEYRGVGFRYVSRPDNIVLDDFNLTVEAGEVVALAGCSGGGKTTVYSLLAQLFQPSSGSILLDGVDIKTLNPTWMRQKVLAVVNQEPILFSGTIMDNIRYGRPDATDDQVVAAAKNANADEFISKFSREYRTTVGPNGAQLSVGQKQRIAIARAILKDPKILILDEATNSLDAESEGLIHQALERAMKGRTVLIIGHHQGALKFASRVVFTSKGKVADMGTFDELSARNAAFKTFLVGSA